MTLQERPNASGSPQWLAVYITHNAPEAHIVLGKLKAQGLPAMLHQEAGASALGITLGNLGEIKILVAPADFARAQSLIARQSQEALEETTGKITLIWQDDRERQDQSGDDDE